MLDSSNGSCAEQPTKRTSAVIYARMSFEHQQYSTENQCDVIREYAARHDMDILRTYTDEGKSGLRLGRIFEENSAKSLDL